MTTDTDRLVAQATSGDASATEELLTRHRERLKRMVALRMDDRLRARFDPSDVVQEALITVHARLPGYLRERRIAFYPWLRNITWEHLVKFHERHLQAQKRSVQREVFQRLELSDGSALVLVDRLAANVSSPSMGMVRKEMKDRIQQAMSVLKPRDREILELIYLEQLEAAEVADILSVSRPTVWTRHMRALQRLTKLLDQERESGN